MPLFDGSRNTIMWIGYNKKRLTLLEKCDIMDDNNKKIYELTDREKINNVNYE